MTEYQRIDHSEYTKNWRKSAVQQRKDGKNADVTFELQHGINKFFHCHRVILESATTYFTSIFDKYAKDQVIPLTNEDLSEDIFQLLLDYMYTAEISINLANVIQLNQYSGEFYLQELHEATFEFMENNIKNDTCLKYWRHANIFKKKSSNKKLSNKCIKFITENPTDFFVFSLMDLDEKEMETICTNLRALHYYDSLILSNIIDWIKIDLYNRQYKFNDLIENVNANCLSVDDIKKLEDDSRLQNITTILKFINDYYKNNHSSLL